MSKTNKDESIALAVKVLELCVLREKCAHVDQEGMNVAEDPWKNIAEELERRMGKVKPHGRMYIR